MSRHVRMEEHRFVGDKRVFVVHDQDNLCDAAVIDSIAKAESWLCFGPDTTDEARNRGYSVCAVCAGNATD